MTAKTRADLIELVADSFGEYLKVTATGGSTTTIADTARLYQSDNFWVGHFAYILTDAGGLHAAPEGEERPVSDFDQASATLTVAPAFTAAVGAGDICELLPVQRHTLVLAINAAIQAAGITWLVPADDDDIELDEDVYDYDLPTDLVTLNRVLVREGTDEPWREVPASNWRVTGTPGAQVLTFDTWNGLSEDYTLRLEYGKRPSELATDAATLGMGEPGEADLVEFVKTYALYWLHDRAANKANDRAAFQHHYTKGDVNLKLAMALKNSARGKGRVKAVRTARMPRARG